MSTEFQIIFLENCSLHFGQFASCMGTKCKTGGREALRSIGGATCFESVGCWVACINSQGITMATEMNFHGCQRRGILTVGLISKTCTGGMLPPSTGSIIRWGCLRTASVLSAKSECRSMSTSSGPQAWAHVSFKRTKRKLEVHRRNHGQTVGYSLGHKNLNLGSSVTVCQTIRSRLGFFYKARFQIPMFSNCGEPAKSSISRRR